MGKFLNALVASTAAVMAFAATPALAAELYNFTYTFDTGAVASGSFIGNGPITAITNISNVTLTVDSVLVGPVNAYSYTGYSGVSGPNNNTFSNTGAVVSSNTAAENFIFGTDTSFNASSEYFYIIPWTNGGGNQVASQAQTPGNLIDAYNGQYTGKFTVTAIAAVPEPATWALMLIGFGMIGFAMRKRARTTVAYA